MKKSLLALAAMGAFAGAAQAQSSVTVYGVYDGGYNMKNIENKTTSSATATVFSNSDMTGNQAASSRLGFRGAEDLGGGLTATFNLELGFEPGTGTVYTVTSYGATGSANQSQSDGVRTSVVGLSSKTLGSINVGRQLSGMHGILAGNVFGGNNMIGDMTYASFTNPNGQSTRINNLATRFNGISYISPTISGFTARVDYSQNRATGLQGSGTAGSTFTTTGTTYQNEQAVQVANAGISANYQYGPFRLQAGTHKVSSTTGNATAYTGVLTETTINGVSGTYSAKGLVINAVYGQNKSTSAGVTTASNNGAKIAVSYQITPQIMPFAQYGTGVSEASKALTSANTANSNMGYQAGAMYSLSKRTNLYAVYGVQKSENKTSTATSEGKEAGIGILHTF